MNVYSNSYNVWVVIQVQGVAEGRGSKYEIADKIRSNNVEKRLFVNEFRFIGYEL
jgi:hypothetical protein